MISIDVAHAIAPFFDQFGPSHDQLTTLFGRHGLLVADPRSADAENVGKMRRVRAVLSYAVTQAPTQGAALARDLLAALRASGSFRVDSPNYPGGEAVENLRKAFDREGYLLDDDGGVRRKQLETMEGTELTEALEQHVTRALLGDRDAALLVGNSKDLIEATARHVLVQVSGAYQENLYFPGTLYNAFDRLGLPLPPLDQLKEFDDDAVRALNQGLFLVACAVNRLRNQKGTGHGRPQATALSPAVARTASRGAGIVSALLLDTLAARTRTAVG